jgi:hypothetical protein
MKKTILILTIITHFVGAKALAFPPPEDIPEEILRTEIITEGRSPINGEPLNAAEYAELEEKLATSETPLPISPKIRELIFLLNIRDFFKTITPF